MMSKFSQLANRTESSAIREILKITEQPDVISFAGGLPSPDTFPEAEFQAAFANIVEQNELATALQYGPTEGYRPLRQWIADYVSTREQCTITLDNVLIVSGSQQSLDLIGKVLIDAHRKIMVESPTYLGGLQSFNQYRPDFYSIDSDEHSLIPDTIPTELSDQTAFIYTIPNFQNPTGRRLPLARRQALAQLAKQHQFILVEDDPYGDLDYVGQRLPTLYSMLPEQTLYLGSFSKILSPGLRLGYIIADPIFIQKLVQIKQATDLHTSSLTQHLAYQILQSGCLPAQIEKTRTLYAARCTALVDALTTYMPATVQWHQPEGGMFIWVTLPAHMDSNALLLEAIKHKVAFVPGESFFATHPKKQCLRLSFVTMSPEKIDQGIQILAQLIKQQLD